MLQNLNVTMQPLFSTTAVYVERPPCINDAVAGVLVKTPSCVCAMVTLQSEQS